MIIDCHTHIISEKHLSQHYYASENRGVPVVSFAVELEDHYKNASKADKVFVLGIWAPFSGIKVPNDYIADYVKKDPTKLIGFMSVDPNDKNSINEIKRCARVLGLKGIKLLPMYQDFHPLDYKKAYPIYALAQEMNMPIIFHMGTTFLRRPKLIYTQPILIEEIALDFPLLKMVIAHLGHPWEEDTIVLIRKQPNVYADISALYYRPWQFYNSLRLAKEYGVLDKLLFGTDYPATTIESTINGLYSICELAKKANLPPIEEKEVESIINRDSLKLLSLE
ncbi:MAG: amidohydrolase [Candidatus Marinimicrobia bacterium]|nr:amidohydrolase [Candidatus Neomarinimicrobiota bacterium]